MRNLTDEEQDTLYDNVKSISVKTGRSFDDLLDPKEVQRLEITLSIKSFLSDCKDKKELNEKVNFLIEIVKRKAYSRVKHIEKGEIVVG